MKQLIAMLPLLLTACALDPDGDVTGTEQQDLSLGSAYATIRAQEANFPLPMPRQDETVGTYNVATGAYSGLQSTTTYVIGADGKPHPLTYTPSVTINAVGVRLVFNLTNHTTQPVSLTVGSTTVNAPPYATTIAIEMIGDSATWTLRTGAYSRTDSVRINRPYIVGAGVFTVAAMPVSIEYEPPQDPNHINHMTYTTISTLSNKFSMAITDDSSTTRDADPEQYDDVATLEGSMDALKQTLALAPNVPARSAVTAAIGAIDTALGSVSASQIQGTSTSNGSDLTVTDTDTNTYTTTAHLGPGQGDRILYLTNARFVWLCDRGVLTIALLGADGERADDVASLQADLAAIGTTTNLGPTTHQSADMIRALLALDPFVAGGPSAHLDPTRFVPIDSPSTHGGTGGTDTFAIAHTVAASDTQSTAAFTQLITDERAGWLAFAGIGVTDTAKISSKTTHSESHTTSSMQTVSSQVTLAGPYNVTGYYDTVFGGFAVVNTP